MRKHAGLRGCVKTLAQRYNDPLDFIDNPPEDCQVIQIAPTRHLMTKRTTRDQFSLEADYHLGRSNAFEFMAHSGDLLLPKVDNPVYLTPAAKQDQSGWDQPLYAAG